MKDLFAKTYLSDVIEHNKIMNEQTAVNSYTIGKYLDYFIDAFIMYKAFRYDIKGKKYLETPLKYYFTDVGLRNARLNFRQQEENRIMENIIFNELMAREFDVDVGMVQYHHIAADGKKVRSMLEVDFVANKGSKRYYIQSALTVAEEEKRKQEINSLNRIEDSFKKIVVVREDIISWHDEQGILYVGIEQFLLEENALDL